MFDMLKGVGITRLVLTRKFRKLKKNVTQPPALIVYINTNL